MKHALAHLLMGHIETCDEGQKLRYHTHLIIQKSALLKYKNIFMSIGARMLRWVYERALDTGPQLHVEFKKLLCQLSLF